MRPLRGTKTSEASKLIDLLGGTGAVAALVDVSPPAVCEWRRKGKIPARRFCELVKHLGAMNVEVNPDDFGMIVKK